MLVDKFRQEYNFVPYIQTGTIADIVIGSFIPGINNKMYLNGGLHCTSVIGGKPQTYKSAEGGSFLARILYNYKEIEAIVYETEFNVSGPERYDDFVPFKEKKISDRVCFISAANQTLDEFFDVTIMGLCKEKLIHKKDYTVESPFINPKTMEPYLIWIPTLIFTDSWSFATVSSVNETYEKNKGGVDDAGMNTMFMKEGMVKTRINRAIPNLAAKYGIYFICTAHIDEKINMDPRSHPTKVLQHMKPSDCFKNVGGSFEFLTSTLFQTIGATSLLNSDKTASFYPTLNNGGPINEVNEVNSIVVKNKNNASGGSIPFVISQYQGILNEVTNYHYLKKYNYGFIDEKGRNDNLYLSPKQNLYRTTIRETVEKDYELRRALELTTQLCFIQNNWMTDKLPPGIKTPINKFAEMLTKSTKPSISDILNSTGVWSISKSDREYMSIFDVVNIISKS